MPNYTQMTFTGTGGKKFNVTPEGYKIMPDTGEINKSWQINPETGIVSRSGGGSFFSDPFGQITAGSPAAPRPDQRGIYSQVFTGRGGQQFNVNPQGYRLSPTGEVTSQWVSPEGGVFYGGQASGSYATPEGQVVQGWMPRTPLSELKDPQLPWQATIAGQMEGLMQEGSPYLEGFRQRAREEANRRGLLNSAMATTAGEQAAWEGAYPIAAADADVAARSYLMGQEYGAKQDLERMISDEHLRRTGFTLSGNLQGKFADHIAQIQSTTRQAIQNVMISPDMSESVKEQMIADIEAQRDYDLQFINEVYGDLPVWQTGFTTTVGETPPGSIVDTLGELEPEAPEEAGPYPFGEAGNYAGEERFTQDGLRYIWDGTEWKREDQYQWPIDSFYR